jgi:hypothetical protein
MREPPVLSAAIQAALLGALVLALLGATGVAALHGGAVPQFRRIMAAGPDLALVVENGPFCVVDAPLVACNTRVKQEFRVWLYASNTKHGLLAYTWRQ